MYSPLNLKSFEGTRPVLQPVRRLSHKEKDAVQRHVDGLLEAGILTPSRSPWQSPVVLVKKGNGELGVCADLSTLIMYIKLMRFALPLIPDILYWARGSQYFTSIDLKSACQQIPMAQQAKMF